MTNKEYWDGLIRKYETMSDEEFMRLMEEIDNDCEPVFFIEDDSVEYVINDPAEKDCKYEYRIEFFDVKNRFSSNMDEEGAAA